MKYVKTIGKLGLALALGLVCHGAGAAQLVSSLPPTAAAGVTAGGESVLQAVTPDGRFVLFASTANNLALTTNQTGSPFPQVPHLNLYRRDRQVGTNVMVSAALTGGAGTGDSVGGDISSNGNWVVFMSTAADLVAGDTNGVTDVFVRSLDTGATTLVSVSTNGGCANGASRNPVMTPDGRYVAFVSAAANMVAGDTNGLEDVFVRDLQSGETRLVSVGAKSALPVSASGAPQISADGRYVAFMSSATNLVPTVRTTYEIYLRDLQLNQTVWVSGGAHALMWSQTNNSSGVFYNIALSDDGQYVAFEGCTLQSPFKAFILRYHLQTDVTDLISSTNVFKEAFTINTYSELPEDYRSLSMSPDGQYIAFVAAATNGANTCVMMWDSLTGTNTLVSELVNGLGTTNTVCLLPEVAPSGRYVAFLSNDPNLVTNRVSDDYQLYCRDVQEGRTLLISADTNGMGLGVDCLCEPRFSAAGLAFDSAGGGLVPLDFNRAGDVFVRDLKNDAVELVSARDAGLPSRATGVAGSKFSLSADGRYLAFASAADGLVPGDTNGLRDIYVRDLEADTITLVSVSTNGFTAGNGASAEPVISGDGRYVAFSSLANDLTADDPDNLRDVFVRDLVTGNTVNVSANLDNTTFSEFSGLQMDAGGRHILFGDSGQQTIHLMDLQSLLVTNLPTANAAAVAMSPNGRYILYYPGFSIMQRVGIWDSEVSTIIWSNALQTPFVASAIPMGISPDGLKVAYQDGASLQGLNRNSGEHWVWAAGQSGYSTGLRFSIDSRYMVYACTNGIVAADTNLLSDVYLFDFDTGSNRLVSTTSASGCGNGASTAPDLSADGRYVVFRSAASNLVADDTNGLPDIFLLDRTTAKLTCLTQAPGAAGSAADRAVTAKFSPDGHSLVLQTWADNLTPGDFDQAGDLLAVNFLYAKLDGSMTPGSLSWLVTPGINYHVEYSDLLSAPDWKPLSGTVSITGNRGRINDPHPAVSQRWYRVVAEQQ
ncbi:MAG TPA: hypothetical protein VL527_11025 [Dongiaceae bacterium]|nr:hypothetical protein [Dongiaceae bacterium]